MMKNIINEFGGKRQVAYFSCNRQDESIDVEELLQGKYGTLGKILRLTPSDMILLLDEVEGLSREDQEDLLNFYKDDNIKSVVFFGPKFESVSFDIELKKLMVNNVIQLVKLTPDEAVELIRERIGNIKLLSDDIIKKVFKHSEDNPRLLLENLEDLCRYAVENNDDEVSEDHLKEVLGIKPKPKKAAKKKKKTSKKKPKKTKKTATKKVVEEPKPIVNSEPEKIVYDESELQEEGIFVEEIDQPEEIITKPEASFEQEEDIKDYSDEEEPEYFY